MFSLFAFWLICFEICFAYIFSYVTHMILTWISWLQLLIIHVRMCTSRVFKIWTCKYSSFSKTPCLISKTKIQRKKNNRKPSASWPEAAIARWMDTCVICIFCPCFVDVLCVFCRRFVYDLCMFCACVVYVLFMSLSMCCL